MAFTYFLDNKLIDLIFGGIAYSPPATLYFGLSTTTPTSSGGNVTEPVGNGYARVVVTNNTTNFPASIDGSKTNANTITYPTSTGIWGTVTHFVVYDALTNGNFLAFGQLNNSQSVGTDNTLSFSPSAITLTLI